MSNVSFSLTEKFVIDPILSLRGPPPSPEPGQTVSWTATVWQGIQSEVIARAIAVFTSVFAAADALIHFAAGMYKGTCLLARINYNKSAVDAHFQQAAWFARLAVVGSIAGVVWPGILKQCHGSIRLLEQDAGKEIRVPVGKPFTIELWHSPTTGHQPWKISQSPSFINHFDQYVNYQYHPPGVCGGGNEHVFVFDPKESGRGNIVMQQPCSFNASRTEEKTFTIIAV